jgi:hypothetical protein
MEMNLDSSQKMTMVPLPIQKFHIANLMNEMPAFAIPGEKEKKNKSRPGSRRQI